MSVVELAIYAGDDPNGSALATLTDADVSAFEMRSAVNELGAGQFTIRRDHPDAASVTRGAYCKVTIPVIQPDPIFGFWLDSADDTIVSESEEGGEFLTRGGQGSLAVLGWALLLETIYDTDHAFRGDVSIPGYWTWTHQPYGAILCRLIDEGEVEPGSPLGAVVRTFERQHDTNVVPWPDILETVQVEIGTDGLTLYERLIASGNLFVTAGPDLTIHAYGTSPGVDRTSATFATGKVRFAKGVNIETELVRASSGLGRATHALVRGKDLVYRHVVSPSYSSGDAAWWTTVDYGESNDPDLLDAVGLRALAWRTEMGDVPEFAILPGDDESTGQYLPFKHFRPGDTVTVHTGSDPWDYNEASITVNGVRIVLGDTTDDATDELAARSLHVVVESGGSNHPGSLPRRTETGGCSPCPDDFPYVPPTGTAHYYEGTLVFQNGGLGGHGYADMTPVVASTQSSTNQAGTTIESTTAYTYHVEFTGENPSDLIAIAWAIDSTSVYPPSGASSGGLAGGSGLVFGNQTYDGTITTGGALDNTLIQHMNVKAQGAHAPDQNVTVSWWFDPVGWVPPTQSTPAAGQWTPPTAPLEAPDGSRTAFTVPFAPARYAPGSLHVEFNGSRLEVGVDFGETDPTAGTFEFLTITPSANAQIVIWYQQGIG